MAVRYRSVQSTEYERVKVSAKLSGSAVNPTSDVVQLAFVEGAGAPASWQTGSWETDTTTEPDTYYARAVPSSLTAGKVYTVWVKVTDNPEVVVRALAKKLVVTV